MRFADDFLRRAFDDVEPVALNKLVLGSMADAGEDGDAAKALATAAETPTKHLDASVVDVASRWLKTMPASDVAAIAAELLSRVGEPTTGTGTGTGTGTATAGGAARPAAHVLVALALILRARPGALNAAASRDVVAKSRARLDASLTPTAAWVVAQACVGDAVAGFGLWAHLLLPSAIDAGKRVGAFTGKGGVADERRETATRMTAAVAASLTRTTAARRRLRSAALAASIDTGFHPRSVDLLYRNMKHVDASVAQVIGLASEACVGCNGAARMAAVAEALWPVAIAQAVDASDDEKAAQARLPNLDGVDPPVAAVGVDALVWCLGALGDAATLAELPTLCAKRPKIAAEALRRTLGVAEGRGATTGGGVDAFASTRHALKKKGKRTAIAEALRAVRATAKDEKTKGGSRGKSWSELDDAARALAAIVEDERTTGAPSTREGLFGGAKNALAGAAFAIGRGYKTVKKTCGKTAHFVWIYLTVILCVIGVLLVYAMTPGTPGGMWIMMWYLKFLRSDYGAFVRAVAARLPF